MTKKEFRPKKNELEIKDTLQLTTNKISPVQWDVYFKNLYKEEKNIEHIQNQYEEDNDLELTNDKIENTLKSLKNRKSPKPDEMTNDMLKYGRKNYRMKY